MNLNLIFIFLYFFLFYIFFLFSFPHVPLIVLKTKYVDDTKFYPQYTRLRRFLIFILSKKVYLHFFDKFTICLVAVFENCSGKQFLKIIFKNSFLCFKKNMYIYLGIEFWKTVFVFF